MTTMPNIITILAMQPKYGLIFELFALFTDPRPGSGSSSTYRELLYSTNYS